MARPCSEIEASERLIEFLASQRTSETIRNSGMEPLAPPYYSFLASFLGFGESRLCENRLPAEQEKPDR